MGRMTRAKATEIAEQMHIDEDAVLDLPTDARETMKLATPEAEERPPLGDLAPNSASSKNSDDTDTGEKKPGKGKKGGKKGAKASKKKTDPLAHSTATTPEATLEVIPDEIESVPSPASRAASDDLVRDEPELEMSHLPVHDIRPKSPPSSAVRLTRSQLRNAPEVTEPKSLVDEKPEIADSEDIVNAGLGAGIEAQDVSDQPQPLCDTEASVPVDAGDMPNSLQTRSDSPLTPTKRQRNAELSSSELSNDARSDSSDELTTYDQLEAAAVEAQSPPRSTTKESSSRDSITALDRLDDEVEKINAEVALPEVQPSSEKSKPKSKKAAPVVRTTKASQARMSIANGSAPRQPSWGRPSAVGLNQSTARRVSSTENEPAAGKKEIIIPHSKPRPMSLSFPTPPPPPKSTKGPTQSNFSLPGEAIAAKLKAAKEARLAKEAEELEKRRAFKAKPAPSSSKTPNVRQTSTSKARESLMGGKPLASTSGGIHKRANSVATTRPSTGPRLSTVKPTMSARPVASAKPTVPSQKISVGKRPSTSMALLSKPLSRPSTAGTSTLTTTKPARPVSVVARPASVVARPASTVPGAKSNGTSKGKEVFNRAAQAKSAAEKEKREKEEAAKKARLEAAERGRLASREWAEKQRLKKLGDVKTKENVEPTAAVEA